MEIKPTVHFRPESETEIAIWWDFDSELAEIIPVCSDCIFGIITFVGEKIKK